MTRLLEVKSLEGGYDSVQILYEIDIHVDEGEFVTIIGPNGCGKSTLIKTIFGLATYYRGEVSYRGADVSGMRTDQLVNMGISYVPQVDNVFPSLSVIENMRMGGNKLQPQTLSDRIERSLEMFPDLRSREFDLAASLSGGERQMLAISRDLISKPNLLLPFMFILPILEKGDWLALRTGKSAEVAEKRGSLSASAALFSAEKKGTRCLGIPASQS